MINPSVVNELIAGSVAGAAQVIVGQPLDTIKTRAQIAPRAYHSISQYLKERNCTVICRRNVCEC